MAIRPRSANWPSPRYEVGSRDFAHALGVISANFNSLEFQLLQIFRLYARMDAVAAQHAFSKLNNHDRIIVMKRAAESSLHPLRIRNRVLRILEGYAASAENRN